MAYIIDVRDIVLADAFARSPDRGHGFRLGDTSGGRAAAGPTNASR